MIPYDDANFGPHVPHESRCKVGKLNFSENIHHHSFSDDKKCEQDWSLPTSKGANYQHN